MNLIQIIKKMKGLRNIPKILRINEIKGYLVSLLFNNGESRLIDFTDFWLKHKENKNHPAYGLLQDESAFNKIEIMGNTIGWKNVGINSKNIEGKEEFYPYDIDPIVLFERSILDEKRKLKIGELIRSERKKAGLTQEELAKRSGTSKYYISRIENNKSDMELLTLKKIIEAGLGKQLRIQIN